jgi:hypothetical protein
LTAFEDGVRIDPPASCSRVFHFWETPVPLWRRGRFLLEEKMSFRARVQSFSGDVRVAKPVDEAFPLFSPEGERAWAPGWDPESLTSRGWEEGEVFLTRHGAETAAWVVARLDGAAHEVTYYRVEPERYVVRIDVHCTAGDRSTTARVSYSFVGLTDAGNAEIEAMTEEGYREKMANWESLIGGALET